MDKTEAYFDRLIFVEFPNKFRGAEGQVLDYDQVLLQKPKFLPALLNRFVAGLQRLMKTQHFTSSVTSQNAIDTYKRECSSALDFMHECCTDTKNDQTAISRNELYSTYQNWCFDQGVKPVSARHFVKTVREFGATEGKREGTRIWLRLAWIGGRPPRTTGGEILDFGAGKSANEPDAEF
jgi:phage/plasmid-associated DNA primase